MPQVAKVVTIIGSSQASPRRRRPTVTEAADDPRDLGIDVVSMSAEVEGDEITAFRTTVNIAFAVRQ